MFSHVNNFRFGNLEIVLAVAYINKDEGFRGGKIAHEPREVEEGGKGWL